MIFYVYCFERYFNNYNPNNNALTLFLFFITKFENNISI